MSKSADYAAPGPGLQERRQGFPGGPARRRPPGFPDGRAPRRAGSQGPRRPFAAPSAQGVARRRARRRRPGPAIGRTPRPRGAGSPTSTTAVGRDATAGLTVCMANADGREAKQDKGSF